MDNRAKRAGNLYKELNELRFKQQDYERILQDERRAAQRYEQSSLAGLDAIAPDPDVYRVYLSALEALEQRMAEILAEIRQVGDNRALMDVIGGWLHEQYRQKHTAINMDTRVEEWRGSLGALGIINYTIPRKMEVDLTWPPSPIAPNIQYGRATFEKWAVPAPGGYDKPFVVYLAYAPEIDTVFYKSQE